MPMIKNKIILFTRGEEEAVEEGAEEGDEEFKNGAVLASFLGDALAGLAQCLSSVRPTHIEGI